MSNEHFKVLAEIEQEVRELVLDKFPNSSHISVAPFTIDGAKIKFNVVIEDWNSDQSKMRFEEGGKSGSAASEIPIEEVKSRNKKAAKETKK